MGKMRGGNFRFAEVDIAHLLKTALRFEPALFSFRPETLPLNHFAALSQKKMVFKLLFNAESLSEVSLKARRFPNYYYFAFLAYVHGLILDFRAPEILFLCGGEKNNCRVL